MPNSDVMRPPATGMTNDLVCADGRMFVGWENKPGRASPGGIHGPTADTSIGACGALMPLVPLVPLPN